MTALDPRRPDAGPHRRPAHDWLTVLDISRGAWRARDVALQLAEAIGADLPAVETFYDGDDPETIGRGVDAEARGPLPVLVGYRDALALQPRLPARARLALIHDPECPPEDENHWFLTFLKRMGTRIDRLPLPVGAGPRPEMDGLTTAQRALVALFPGPLPPAVAARGGSARCPGFSWPTIPA